MTDEPHVLARVMASDGSLRGACMRWLMALFINSDLT